MEYSRQIIGVVVEQTRAGGGEEIAALLGCRFVHDDRRGGAFLQKRRIEGTPKRAVENDRNRIISRPMPDRQTRAIREYGADSNEDRIMVTAKSVG